jgi:glycosyltransferase involved in cell wall biosynthesis
MNILYVSTLCSDRLIKELFDAGYKPIQAIQKFNKLLVNGLAENGCNLYALTEIPKTVGPRFLKRKRETENGIAFTYCRKIDIKLFYNLYMFLSGFFLTLRWGLKHRDQSVAIMDVLQTEFCSGALYACKLLRIKTVAVVTDLPGLPGMLAGTRRTFIHRFVEKAINRYANSFDAYILLTEQMNEVVNLKGRPYMIMEGLVDVNMADAGATVNGDGRKIVIYAGGLYEEYGIKYLIDGFKMLDDKDAELHLFGHGPMVNEIEEEIKRDGRIRFFGIVHNSKVVEAELQATLLVNPRPTVEDFTKYSFPSKNMEYMVSGTPVLTTNLPGMPKEYHDYVYLLEDESAQGVSQVLKKLLVDTPASELKDKGLSAKQFVLKNKNNIFQSKRVIDFIKQQNVGIH